MNVASLTSQNQLLLDDPNRYRLDMKSNDISQVNRLDALNSSINNNVVHAVTGQHASFVNACYSRLVFIHSEHLHE